jgi:hypothetical protein
VDKPTGNSSLESLLPTEWVKRAGLTLALALSPTFACGAGTGLEWSVTPYIWASDAKYDLKVGDRPIGGEVKFDDLLDTADASFQVVTEVGQAGGFWSAFVDLTYLETSDNYKGQLVLADSESEQWFLDAAIAWWPQKKKGGLSVYGGARYTDLDERNKIFLTDGKLPLTTLRNDRDFLDALIGIRQFFTLPERWSLLARADYSNGESEGIYQVQALVRYGMGRQNQDGSMLGRYQGNI